MDNGLHSRDTNNKALEIAIGYRSAHAQILPRCPLLPCDPEATPPPIPAPCSPPLSHTADSATKGHVYKRCKPPTHYPLRIGSTLFWSDGPLLLRSWALDIEGQDPVDERCAGGVNGMDMMSSATTEMKTEKCVVPRSRIVLRHDLLISNRVPFGATHTLPNHTSLWRPHRK